MTAIRAITKNYKVFDNYMIFTHNIAFTEVGRHFKFTQIV